MSKARSVRTGKDAAKRIVTLDLLRGFFIFVIICDHLLRWPSLLSWVTGQGRLWVSAAEGFFIISGLLVGYIRGYKNRNLDMKSLTKILYKRAATLYITVVLMTLVLLALASVLTFPESLQPMMPVAKNPVVIVLKVLSLMYVFEWVYFLKLYAISFLMAPVFIYLFRKGHFLWAVLLSLALWTLGAWAELDWLQWQFLLFMPALAGFKLPEIQQWWHSQDAHRRTFVKTLTVLTTLGTMALSTFWVFGWKVVEQPGSFTSLDSYVSNRTWIDPLFSKAPLGPARVMLAMLWFVGLYFVFRRFEKELVRWLGWLLLPLGTYSLTAYILHGLLLVFVQALVPISTSSLYNIVLDAVVILAVLALVKLPVVRKILPQ